MALGLATFAVVPVMIFFLMGREPRGWLLVLVGLPAWLLVRFVFFSLRGSETGIVTVDDAGVVHVVSGRRGLRRLMRLYDVGPGSWMQHAVAGGLLLVVLGLGGITALAVLLDTPLPVALLLTGSAFACLDLLRWAALRLLWPRARRQRLLDESALLPALALYARVHGWSAAVSGVRADALTATLAAHPAEAAVAAKYTQHWRHLARVAAPS